MTTFTDGACCSVQTGPGAPPGACLFSSEVRVIYFLVRGLLRLVVAGATALRRAWRAGCCWVGWHTPHPGMEPEKSIAWICCRCPAVMKGGYALRARR